MGVRLFFVSYCAIIVLALLLPILLSIGMFSEVLQVSIFVIVTLILTFLRLRILKYSKKVVRAPPDELQKEDDVLLQAIVMSQSLLLFFVNVTLESANAKLFLSV